jgi:signal transduction histidine kinase
MREEEEFRRIEALYRLSKAVTSTIKLDRLLELALDAALVNLEADAGSILLLDKESGKLRIRASRGLSKKIIKETIIPIGEKVSGIVAKRKRPYLFIDGRFPKDFKGVKVRPRIRSSLCVPLLFLNKTIGVLCINRMKVDKDFTQEELETLWLFASQAAQAISNALFYDEMAQRVKEKTMELEEANRRLVELDRVKSAFLDTVSHELRSPLTSIRSYSEILLSQRVDEKRRHEFLTIIDEEAKRLGRIIDDLLDLSKIEAGRVKFKIRRVSLERIIEGALEGIRPMAEKKGIRIRVSLQDRLPRPKGDRERLIQVMENLLDNAVKFTHEGGRITVKATKKRDHIQVSIRDTGIGIKEEDLGRIFERFFQIAPKGARPRGTGLGLSIVKEIITQHHGKVWVESKIGRGTTFHFTLPI